MYTTANLPRAPLAPPADEVIALRHEVACLREENAILAKEVEYLRNSRIFLWGYIAWLWRDRRLT